MAAAEEEGETLESWLNKATDPLNTEEKWDYIKGFCDQVDLELEGPQIAMRLLGYKIQSPQEREALYALTVLATCMNNCGTRFQNEAGKFRFLNDLIKVLSPKYLGLWSSEQVKTKLIEMLYSWTLWLPNEIKIRDAYQMLKKQGIIKQDPKLPDEKPLPPPSPRMKSSIFDDDEKSKEAPPAVSAQSSSPNGSRGLDGLDLLGRVLMEQSLGSRPQSVRWDQPHVRPSLKDLQTQALTHQQAAVSDPRPAAVSGLPPAPALLAASAVPPPRSAVPGPAPIASPVPVSLAPLHPSPSSPGDDSLKNLFVPLETIKASSVPPVTAFDGHGLRVLFHFARAPPPGRPDLLVIVVSLLSSSPAPITGIAFQAAVPKVMRVKLQPASSTELPAFNPILPPPVVSQVMLLSNPLKEKVRLRYKLLYTLAEYPFTEVGEVTEFPAVETWGSL
uniref:ADP-ribosylation factor-binding protein GGA1-like n=1 Tax=Pristiophorus japonicus TaxID=55135 RepID=UPI00398F1973